MANGVQNGVAFGGAINPYSVELQDIERRRRLAEALQQQGTTPLGDTQVVGGWAIPRSPMEGVGKMAQTLSGAFQAKRASEEEKALGEKYQSDLSSTLTRALRAGSGSEAVPSTMYEDAAGNAAPTDARPAVAPDRAAMGRILMEHPGTAPLGMAQITKDMDTQQRQALLANALKAGGGAGTTGGAAGGASPFNGVPPQVVALMTSGDAELVALGKSILESSKGIAQRQGAPVVNPFTGAVIAQPTPAVPAGVQLNVGPNGPVASPVPGAIPAMSGVTAATAGATEAGKAPYQLETLNTEGAPTVMTREQAIGAATGRPMPTPGRVTPQPAAPQPSPQPFPRVTPQQQSGQDQTRLNILLAERADQQQKGRVDPALDQEIANAQRRSGATGTPTTPIPSANVVPGLRLQDQGDSARQKSFGTERGQLEAAQPQATIAARTTMTNLERLTNVASELETHPGLNGITGKVNQYSALDVVPETRAARALQDTLVKQAAVNTLQSMRDASKTGGAVGAVTEKEWPILEQQLAALNGAQSTDDYRVALKNLQNQMKGAMGRIKSAYQDTYGQPLQYESVPYESQGRARRAGDSQGQRLRAVNRNTGEAIESSDNGKTWASAKGRGVTGSY